MEKFDEKQDLLFHQHFRSVCRAYLLVCLSAIYLYHEVSYDKYHKNIDQLYQLGTTFVGDGKESKYPKHTCTHGGSHA